MTFCMYLLDFDCVHVRNKVYCIVEYFRGCKISLKASQNKAPSSSLDEIIFLCCVFVAIVVDFLECWDSGLEIINHGQTVYKSLQDTD